MKVKVFHPDYNEHREVVMKTVKDGWAAITRGCTTKKDTSVMIRVCHSKSSFLSCMYIHDDFMIESR